MDKFIIFLKDDYLYALCINKTPVHIFFENKYIVFKYKDVLFTKKSFNKIKLIHKKEYESIDEDLIKTNNISEIRMFFKNILGYYNNELLNDLNTVD